MHICRAPRDGKRRCDNMLVDLRDLQRPVVKIGDLGLSKTKKGSFVSGNMRGTLPWCVLYRCTYLCVKCCVTAALSECIEVAAIAMLSYGYCRCLVTCTTTTLALINSLGWRQSSFQQCRVLRQVLCGGSQRTVSQKRCTSKRCAVTPALLVHDGSPP